MRSAGIQDPCGRRATHEPKSFLGRNISLDAILALDWKKIDPAAFAAVQIARMTGDRSRDLPDDARAAVVQRLEAMGAASAWIAMVRETVELDRADEGRVFGETLPAGLKLIR